MSDSAICLLRLDSAIGALTPPTLPLGQAFFERFNQHLWYPANCFNIFRPVPLSTERLPQTKEDQLRLEIKQALDVGLQGDIGEPDVSVDDVVALFDCILCTVQIAQNPGDASLNGVVIKPSSQVEVLHILCLIRTGVVRFAGSWDCINLTPTWNGKFLWLLRGCVFIRTLLLSREVNGSPS